MQQGQRLNTDDGVQVLLFPLDQLQITQGCQGEFSHQGSNAMDCIGNTTQYPYYAPCDLELVRSEPVSASYYYHSIDPVYLADGTTSHITLLVIHDCNTYQVGRVVNQGDFLGRTGVCGQVTGDHVHIEMCKGHVTSMTQNSYGVWQLANNICPNVLMFINDTLIINDFGYTWSTYEGGVIPPRKQKGLPIWLMGSR